MASPQTEDGYTRTANELVEALCRTNLSAYEGRVIRAVERKTYGWNKRDDIISAGQIAKLTGMTRPNVQRTLHQLVRRRILTKSSVPGSSLRRYGIQKDYKRWLCPESHSSRVHADLEDEPEHGLKLPADFEEAYTGEAADLRKLSDSILGKNGSNGVSNLDSIQSPLDSIQGDSIQSPCSESDNTLGGLNPDTGVDSIQSPEVDSIQIHTKEKRNLTKERRGKSDLDSDPDEEPDLPVHPRYPEISKMIDDLVKKFEYVPDPSAYQPDPDEEEDEDDDATF